MHAISGVPVLLAAFVATACKPKPWPEGPPATEAEHRADALWKERCSTCHGVTGRGDGPLTASLKARPQDFSDPVWQKEDPDDHLELVILLGGPAAGYSEEMPANPELNAHPDVVKALVRKIRSFSR